MANRGYPPPEPIDNPYEQIVKVYTAVFSVLVSISLKDLLTQNQFGPYASGPPLAFGGTLFVVIRFLAGSANHLWVESREHASRSKSGGGSASWSFTSHLIALSAFGFLLIHICRSTDTRNLLLWDAVFAAAAGVVAFLVVMCGKREPAFAMWRRWFWIDVVQAVCFYGLWRAFPLYEQPISIPLVPVPCSLMLLAMAVISLLGMIFDLHFQIKKLESLTRLPS